MPPEPVDTRDDRAVDPETPAQRTAPTEAQGGPARSWSSDGSGVLDDSVANTVKQIALAIGGMFLAFAAAEWLNAQLWTDATGTAGFFLRGATFCVLGAGSIFLTSARPIRTALVYQRDAIDRHEAELRSSTERHRLVGRLQSAFDMAESDQDAFVSSATPSG